MKNLETIIKKAAEDNGLTFTLATPSEENLTADDLASKLLWLDIQQEGTFDITAGFKLTASLKLHFMDDQEWDEEGEVANERKNAVLISAFDCFRAIQAGIIEDGTWEVNESPSWQVLYNVNDRNKIDVMVTMRVVELKTYYC